MRVLRIYHSAVVSEFRWRERLLRQDYGHDVQTVVPPAWEEGGSLVVADDDPDVPLRVVKVHGPRKPNLFWYDIGQLRGLIRLLKPEIVDLHEEPYSLAAAGVLRALHQEGVHPRICVYSAQNLIDRTYPPPFAQIERLTLARSVSAFPCSSEAGQRLRRQGFTGQLHVIPLGVEAIPKEDLEARLETEASLPRPALRVGFVGRLEHYKGGHLAVHAFASAAAEMPSLSMRIIGAGSEAGRIQEMAVRLGVNERVEILGSMSQDDTLRAIDTLQIMLVPSLTTSRWKEQYGRIAAQAMAHGVAVIASDSGSLAEVVGDAGVLVPEGDADALATALAALARDPISLEQLRRRGHERAHSSLAWSAVAASVDAMYRGSATQS